MKLPEILYNLILDYKEYNCEAPADVRSRKDQCIQFYLGIFLKNYFHFLNADLPDYKGTTSLL